MSEIRQGNVTEFHAYWKGRVDLDQNSPGFQALLKALEEASGEEQEGRLGESTSVLQASVKVKEHETQTCGSGHAVSSGSDGSGDSNQLER
jgi:hypothetical protein